MNARRLDHFAFLLRNERERIRTYLQQIAAAPALVGSGEPGDDGYVGISGAAPEDDAAVAASEASELHAIENALRLIGDSPHEYGICAQCGRPIPDERLEIMPATRLCGRRSGNR